MTVDVLEPGIAEAMRPSVAERVKRARERPMPDEREVAFGRLADEAITSLREFLGGDEVDSKAIGKARVAASALSAWTRHEQTKGARDATLYAMARDLASNKDQLAQYIAVTMPGSPLVKALPPGNKEK